MRSTLRYLRHSAPHGKGVNPIGDAPVPGYPIAAAIGPIVPVPLISTEPNWLETELHLHRCAPQVQYVQATLPLRSCRA